MKVRKEASGRYIVRLERGERLRHSLEGLADDHAMGGARIWAIGALEDPELGWWDLSARIYHRRVFGGIWELLSCDGNLSRQEDKPLLHLHVAISGHDYEVKGGHLFDARVGIALEMFLDPLEEPLERAFCPDIGLPRWEP